MKYFFDIIKMFNFWDLPTTKEFLSLNLANEQIVKTQITSFKFFFLFEN